MDVKTPNDFVEGVVLLVDKPIDWTSFDVVNKVRAMLGKYLNLQRMKVGHAGTLDPLATGLLLICTGKATKRMDEFVGLDKEYTGTITLGATTPSYDLETKIDKTFPIDHVNEEVIKQTANRLTGEICQLPPAYSAKRINGQKAYLKARKGKKVQMKPTQVAIREFQITRVQLPHLDFRVTCGKGTYIRSLANDFGEMLESGAYLSKLCRTKIGEYNLQDAHQLPKLEELIARLQGIAQ